MRASSSPCHELCESDSDSDDAWLRDLVTAHRAGGRPSVDVDQEPSSLSESAEGRIDKFGQEHVQSLAFGGMTAESSMQQQAHQLLQPAQPAPQQQVQPQQQHQPALTYTPSFGGIMRTGGCRDREPFVEPTKFKTFVEVAKYVDAKAMKVYTSEVPQQDSIIFESVKECCVLVLGVAHGAFFNHVVARLMMWKHLFGVIIFKVGIAAEPSIRYNNLEFGYAKEGIWRLMDVVVRGPANVCRQLEIELISALGPVQGCYNEKPGGEGVGKDKVHLCFVYLVVADAGHGHALQVSCKRRRQDFGGVGVAP
jgi:hypothetical protein